VIHGLCASGDIGGGEIGLVGGSGQQRADVGDGGIVAADKVLGRVGVGWRERGAQRAELLYQRPYPTTVFAQERLVSESIRSGICMSLFQPSQHAAIIAS
jgi:hypothetical protein